MAYQQNYMFGAYPFEQMFSQEPLQQPLMDNSPFAGSYDIGNSIMANPYAIPASSGGSMMAGTFADADDMMVDCYGNPTFTGVNTMAGWNDPSFFVDSAWANAVPAISAAPEPQQLQAGTASQLGFEEAAWATASSTSNAPVSNLSYEPQEPLPTGEDAASGELSSNFVSGEDDTGYPLDCLPSLEQQESPSNGEGPSSAGEFSSEAAYQIDDNEGGDPFACLGPDPQLLLSAGEDSIPSFDFEEAVRAAAAHPASPAAINPALLEQPPSPAPLSPQAPGISGSLWGGPPLAGLSLPSPIIATSPSANPVMLQESPYAASLTPTLPELPLPPQQRDISFDREDSPSMEDILSLELDEAMGEPQQPELPELPQQQQEQQQQCRPATPLPAPITTSTTTATTATTAGSKKRKAGADERGEPSDQGAAKKRKVASSSNTCRECRRKKAKCQPAPDGSGDCTGCAKSGHDCVRDGHDGRTHTAATGELAASVLDFKRKALCVLYLVWLARTGRLAGPALGTVRSVLSIDTLSVCRVAAELAESKPEAEALVARIDAAAAPGAVQWPAFVHTAEHVVAAGDAKLKVRRDSLEAFRKDSRAMLARLRVVLGAAVEEDGLRDSGLLSEAVLVAVGQVLCNDMHTHPSSDQLAELATNPSWHLDRPETYGYYDLAQFSSAMITRAGMRRFTDCVDNFPEWDGFGKFYVWVGSEFSAKDGFKSSK